MQRLLPLLEASVDYSVPFMQRLLPLLNAFVDYYVPFMQQLLPLLEACVDCGAAVQRVVKAGLLSSANCDSIIADRITIAELLRPHDISQLFTNPVEVIAFSDEEGVR